MDRLTLANNVLSAVSACPEFKAAAKNYIDTPADDSWAALVAEAKEDISPIEGTVEFFKTDMAKQIFGAELAAEKLAHAEKIMAEGAIYCDCPGCTAALAIINAE